MARICSFGAGHHRLSARPLQPRSPSASDNLAKHHALSLIGKPAYGPDFTHFDWVNPNAPKGGRVRQMDDGHLRFAQPVPIKGSRPRGST